MKGEINYLLLKRLVRNKQGDTVPKNKEWRDKRPARPKDRSMTREREKRKMPASVLISLLGVSLTQDLLKVGLDSACPRPHLAVLFLVPSSSLPSSSSLLGPPITLHDRRFPFGVNF